MVKHAAAVAKELCVQGWGRGTCASPQPALALRRAPGAQCGCFAMAG